MVHPCPCCHSFETESLRSVYQRGAPQRKTGFRSVAPPRKKRVMVLVILLVLTVTAIGMRLVLSAAAMPGTAATLGAGSSISGGLMRVWERSVQCRGCGYVFAPGVPLELLTTSRAAQEPRSALLPHA
jgi:hypothetical protein